MRAGIFGPEHDDYRESVRAFLAKEVVPHLDDWERDGIARNVFRAAAAAGMYGLEVPEAYGGPEVQDMRFRLVLAEEFARARATALCISLANQDDLVIDYLLDLGTEEQKKQWLPGVATGETLGALGMTEPGAGSDLRSIRTTAKQTSDGDWVINGQKTFITHGPTADLVVLAARADREDGKFGLTLFLVPSGTQGFVRGRKLDKVGLRSQDTGELFFEDMILPNDAVLGEPGMGLRHLMAHLPRERLGTSVTAITDARAIYELTVQHVFSREAFGSTIGDLQATRFTLAEMSTEIDIAEVYLDHQIEQANKGALDQVDAAKGKWWITELQKRVIDACVQLHGGYGFMLEYPVARAYLDVRIQTIYGGATEVMKEIIGRDIAAQARA